MNAKAIFWLVIAVVVVYAVYYFFKNLPNIGKQAAANAVAAVENAANTISHAVLPENPTPQQAVNNPIGTWVSAKLDAAATWYGEVTSAKPLGASIKNDDPNANALTDSGA